MMGERELTSPEQDKQRKYSRKYKEKSLITVMVQPNIKPVSWVTFPLYELLSFSLNYFN